MYSFNEFEGINDLINDLNKIMNNASNPQDILEIGAQEFVKDLLKLPKPISKIRKSGYTHLIETFTYQKVQNNEINIGWGKYYGRMVEDGTFKTRAQPHLKPTYEKNKEKYYKIMIERAYR